MPSRSAVSFIIYPTIAVIPAQAGIQGPLDPSLALAPRFRGGDELKLGAHQRAVFLPEAADRRLAGAEGLRLGVVSAHHHDAAVLVIVVERALHKAADAAILQCDIAGRADEIAVAQPALGHRLVIVGKAEMHPFELGAVDAARPQYPDGDRVADLLQHHAREYR